MSYEFGLVLSLALLKFLMLWFVWLDTERKPSNYITRVNGVKFFRAGVCTPTRACARKKPAPSLRKYVILPIACFEDDVGLRSRAGGPSKTMLIHLRATCAGDKAMKA